MYMSSLDSVSHLEEVIETYQIFSSFRRLLTNGKACSPKFLSTDLELLDA